MILLVYGKTSSLDVIIRVTDGNSSKMNFSNFCSGCDFGESVLFWPWPTENLNPGLTIFDISGNLIILNNGIIFFVIL